MKRVKDQRGVAHLLLIVLVVIVVAAIGAVGYKVVKSKDKTTKNNSNSSSTVSTSDVEAKCNAQYHDKDLCKFEAAAAAKPMDKISWTATMTTTADGKTSTTSFKHAANGDTQLNTSDGSLDSVEVSGATYIKNGNVWIKYPPSNAPNSNDPTQDLSFLDSVTDTQFTKIGTEACDGSTCLKYKIVTTAMPNATQYAWFDTKTYQLREYSQSDSGGSTDMKISYQSVNITAPSPVQDFHDAQ